MGRLAASLRMFLHLSAEPGQQKRDSIKERTLIFSLSPAGFPSQPAFTRASLHPSISSAVPKSSRSKDSE